MAQPSELVSHVHEENDRVHELSVLNRIATDVNSTLELDRVLDLVVREAKDILGVEACSLVLRDDQSNNLVFKVGFGLPEGEERQIHLNIDEGIAGWVAREGRAAIVHNVKNDPRWCGEVDKLTGFVTRSIAAFPVFSKNHVIAVIEAINKIEGQFSDRDLQLLQSISTAVSTAVQNAQLYGELNRTHEELERVHLLVLQSRDTLRALFDGITDSIWIVDRSLKITAINQSAARRMGLLPKQCIGLQCPCILLSHNERCENCPTEETFKHGKEISFVETLREKDGSKRDYEVRTYPLRDAKGEVEKVIHIVQDITARRRMEEALLQSARLTAVGELAAGVAHDISNPITAVIANAQMLLQNLNSHDPNRQLAELIERAGKRTEKAARNLLNLSRNDEYVFAPADLNATIEEALSLISLQLSRQRIQIIKHLGELPLIRASASHLDTVWTNLLINARDAMTGDRLGEIEITTRFNPTDRSIQATFADNGTGIEQDEIGRIFEPFFTCKRRERGTGLGLYISRVIVTKHMGTIEVSSIAGQGTKFTVTLPIDGPNEQQSSLLDHTRQQNAIRYQRID